MRKSPYSSSCCSSSSPPSSSSSFTSEAPNSQPETQPKPKRAKKASSTNYKNAPTPVSSKRSSNFRGVTRHRWTGRFEAHLWDKSSWNNIQNKKGRQVYLGAYDNEEAAARTYDLAALKYWGADAVLNFPIESYGKDIEEMSKTTKEEYLASLRRQSSGFSRGVSKYRGVARHHHNGRWEARIGRVLGNKYLYLGTYNTQEEAAEAYDMAAIEYRGANAVTNFDVSNYIDRLRRKGVSLDGAVRPPSCPNSSSATVELSPTREELCPEQDGGKHEVPLVCSLEAADDFDWSIYMDIGLGSLPVASLQFDGGSDLPDYFSNVGFEDNIEKMLEGCYGGGSDGSWNGVENCNNGDGRTTMTESLVYDNPASSVSSTFL